MKCVGELLGDKIQDFMEELVWYVRMCKRLGMEGGRPYGEEWVSVRVLMIKCIISVHLVVFGCTGYRVC